MQSLQQYELDFKTLTTAQPNLQYLNLTLSEFPSLQESNLVIESKRGKRARAFISVLSQQLKNSRLDWRLMKFVIEPVDTTEPMTGILYGYNVHVIPISITMTDSLKQWISAIESDINDASLTAIGIRLTPTGGAASYSYKTSDETNPFCKAALMHTPVAFIIANAPMGFDPEAAVAERDEFTAEFQTIAPTPTTDEKYTLQALWKAIVLKQSSAKDRSDNTPDFNRFASLTGFPFPPELHAIHEVVQAHGPRIDYYNVLTFEQILEEWQNAKNIFDTWTLEELTRNTEPDGDVTIGIYMHTHRIPIASDGNGNCYAYDLIPGKKGSAGQIVEFGADCEKSRLVSISLLELLKSI